MATYVNNLRLKEITTGDESGTWGTSTNTNLELIGEALGIGTEAITTNADTHSTIVADGSADAGRAMYLKYTGALDSDCTITITPNTMKRVQIIENATTDSGSSGPYNIIISQGSGANVTIANGKVAIVQLDGAGSGAAVLDALTDLQVTDTLSVNGTTITLGDGTAEDTKLVFDGNAQDFYVGLDDSADDLLIGLGSTVGTTPIISVDENKDVAIPDGGLTITTSDNTDQLSLVSTDADANSGPNLRMYRNSGSPADGDVLGAIEFEGRNDNSEDIKYAELFAETYDVSDGTEDGRFFIKTMVGGSSTHRMYMNFNETNFNEGSADIDFRVESNGNANMLFVDGGNDRLGIGGNGPDCLVEITGAHTSSIGMLHLDSTDHAFIALDAAGATNDKGIYFQEAGTSQVIIDHDGSANQLRIHDGSSTHMVITDAGLVGIGTTSPSTNLHVYSTADNAPHLLLENYQNADTDDAAVIELYLNDQTTGGIGDDTDVGVIRFTGDEKDGGTKETYAEMRGVAHDPGQGASNKGNLSFFIQAAGDLNETLTLDEAKVGINQAAPSADLHITGSSDTKIIIEDGTDEQFITAHSGGLNYGVVSGDAHTFVVDGTDKVQFKDGFYGFGATAAIDSEVMNLTRNGATKFIINCTENSSARDALLILHTRSTGAQCRIGFNDGAGAGTGAGQIYYNHDGNSMTFITAATENMVLDSSGNLTIQGSYSPSDGRLKENIEDFSYDIEKFKAYSPKTFDWINPEEHGGKTQQIGFIAQEQEAIDPRFIEEIETDADRKDTKLLDTITKKDGDIKGISKTSEFTQIDAMYVSVIQQLITRLETAEEKITALEGGK